MATFTAGANDHFRPYRFTRIMYFLEAAAQSFKAGHVVTIDGAGRLVKGGTDPAAASVVGQPTTAAVRQAPNRRHSQRRAIRITLLARRPESRRGLCPVIRRVLPRH